MDTIIDEDRPSSGKKIFVDYISKKELVSKIHTHRPPMMCGQKGPHAKPDMLKLRGGPYKLRDQN